MVAEHCYTRAVLQQTPTRQMATAATGSASAQPNDPTGIHRYKLAPPLFDGDYSKHEDWKHKFIAYRALQHPDYTRLLKSGEAATTVLADADLQTSAQDDEEAKRWASMSRDLHDIFINIFSGSAATVVRQQGVVRDSNSFETFKVLHQTFSLPVGTRSKGYLITLLKPKFEEQSFEENFLQWEYGVARNELDNRQALPDTVKVAILLDETNGALPQNLQLRAGQVTTYSAMRSIVVEYYRATTTLSKLKMMRNPSTNNYNGPQPIGYKGKGKGKHKGKNNKRKGYKGKSKGKMTGKGKDTGKGYGGSYGQTGKGKGKDYNGGKDNSKEKGKGPVCYKCNRTGHFARECRMPIYQIQQQDDYNHDATYDWYNGSYDNSWHSYNYNDQQQVNDTYQQPAIVDTSQQQASATTGQQQQPISYKIGTVKEFSVLMVGDTHIPIYLTKCQH